MPASEKEVICMKTTFAAVFTVLAMAWVAHAQDEPDPAELKKQYDRLRYQNFSRSASGIYDAVTRYAQMDPEKISPADEFARAYFESRWDDVRKTLEMLPEDLGKTVYAKMLNDLTGQNVPVLTLDDFIGFSDACLSEPDHDQLRKMGLLLRIAVPKEQELWLRQALEKGTRYFGNQPSKRLRTGRLLMHAGLDELAREYLPDEVGATQIDDSRVRGEVLRFLAAQDALDDVQQSQVAELWEQRVDVLRDASAETKKREYAAERLADLIGKAPLPAVKPHVRGLIERDLDAALLLAGAVGERTQGRLSDKEVKTRANCLKAQKAMLACLSERVDLSEPPWKQIALAMAGGWIAETEHTALVRPVEPRYQKPHVAPGELLASAPEGPWSKALPTSLQERVDVCRMRAIMLSDRYQDAVPMIVAMAGDNPPAGVSLAEEYLRAWAQRHDPQVPEAIRKKYGLPQDARITVTPIMMEKNIAALAEIMDIFRRGGVHPRNGELLIGVFDVCYSNAEVYRRSHIEKVFGPIDKMDENVFYHTIRTMVEGLSSRWRTMNVQEAAGTRRTQQETLAMVRDGYKTTTEMIDRRSEKHPDAWRILVLAGSMMSDWGDFEYYQQLAGDTGTNRMAAFREKNNLSEQYFAQAAEVYGRQVPKLAAGEYAIDVYLAWFESLLGIGTDGNLNLSKPLDRRLLGKIREAIRALPDGTARTHVNLFAKHVNARLEDTENPLHEELKYTYLSGSLVITKESPFSLQASDKVAYYDELLDELHLQTRTDGPSTIFRDHEFGIILSVRHTEALGRMANFGKYLVNEDLSRSVTNSNQLAGPQGRRDELQMNIEEALALVFDVRAIVFSPADVQPRPAEEPGWEETVLAYIHVKAKDASVDKIPRIQMSLEFLDLSGPITISAESPETMIRVTDQATPPRPFSRVELTQTLDARRVTDTEEALLEVKATACGLVPELEGLLDLEALGRQLPVARIDPLQDTLVQQLNSWGDTVHVVSERQWAVTLDASSLVQEEKALELRLPAAKGDATVVHQAYVDMDLVDLEEPVVTIGNGPLHADSAPWIASVDPRIFVGVAVGAGALVLLLLIVLIRLIRGPRQRPLRARDVFRMPAQLDGFVVVQLLNAMDKSELVHLSQKRRAEMREEIERIQATCFGSNGSSLSADELRTVARKWLKVAR